MPCLSLYRRSKGELFTGRPSRQGPPGHRSYGGASPELRARLGLRTYGTLGGVNGTPTDAPPSGLVNADVAFPDYIIGRAVRCIPSSACRGNPRFTMAPR